jgi:hypothetical protein
MGWTSTADALENVGRASLLFHTKEEAVAFCRKHGWEPQVRARVRGAVPTLLRRTLPECAAPAGLQPACVTCVASPAH